MVDQKRACPGMDHLPAAVLPGLPPCTIFPLSFLAHLLGPSHPGISDSWSNGSKMCAKCDKLFQKCVSCPWLFPPVFYSCRVSMMQLVYLDLGAVASQKRAAFLYG